MGEQSVKSWEKMYTESAQSPSWLEAHRWTYGPRIAEKTVTDVRQKLDLKSGDRVLEVGAGSGAFLMAVLHNGQPGLGLDLCESLVHAGTRLGVDRSRIRLGVAEGLRLPISSESFDKVLCYSVSQHFPDLDYARKSITELVRVCRVGGVVLIGDVCGIMERHRKNLIRRGVPAPLADVMITALLPVRYLRWRSLKQHCAHWLRSYRRSFFVDVLRTLPCEFEMLEQDIPEREESKGRFDVRIRKLASLCRKACCIGIAVAMVAPAAYPTIRCMVLPGHG